MNPSKVTFAWLLVVITLLAMITPAHADHVTITPPSADTFIYLGATGQNYGASSPLLVSEPSSGAPTSTERILVKFDLPSIPSGSTINLAYLQLFYYDYNHPLGDPVGTTYTAYRVTTAWVEGDGPVGTKGATWDQPDKSAAPTWTTAGGDFDLAGAASHTLVAGDLGNYVTWDVTGIVKEWIQNGLPNYGFLIRDPNDLTNGVHHIALFYSKEAPAAYSLQLPILKIDYTLTAIPEYPIGLPLLAIFMIFAYGIIRTRKRIPQRL